MRARLDANTTPYMTHARASALFAGDDLELPVRVRGMKAERRDRPPRVSVKWFDWQAGIAKGRR